ncbi:Protein lap4, partial [Fragariocoptes setiger]
MKCISIFRCNNQVEVIDRSHCSLTDVPNFQNYSRSLEELLLDANQIKLLTKPLFRLTRLRRLNVSDNRIQSIPPDIANLVNLVELDCSRNDIEQIPEQIKFLRGLQYCDFSANNIFNLPSGLVQLRNLTVLTLNNNTIRALPNDFGSLKRLESLELRENEIEELPDSFTSLSSLKRLDLGHNLLLRLPEDIGELSNLEELLVDCNELVSLPSQIGQLKKLQCLDASQQQGKTKLKFVPEEIGGLVSLTDLHLSGNELDYLPDGIGLLQNLLIFKIDSNELSELNPAIGACVSLQELVLTDNQLSELPSSIGKLTQLTSLNADRNYLQYIPPDIGKLHKLGILSLRDNCLTHLPDEIGHCSQLKVLDVAENKLEYLPISVTALNLSALWLSENQSQPLLKFQTDELSDGTKILTCYLLPQVGGHFDEHRAQESRDSENDHEQVPRPTAVKFDDEAPEENEFNSDAQFVRHDTPHPKELKARHQKFIGKDKQSGQQSPDISTSSERNTTEFVTNSSKDATNQYLKNTTTGTSSYPPSNGQQPEDLHNRATSKYEKSVTTVERQISEESRVTMSNLASDFDDNSEAERDRSVSFLPGQAEPPKGKLHRRDTPHHLKNQRISAPTIEQKKKVESLLEHPSKIVVVQVNLVGTNLGLSIAGGKGTPPFRDNDTGIFVSKVTPGGPTEAAGVMVGDKVLAVNDQIFYEGIEHHKAVAIFKRVRTSKSFTLELLRDLSTHTPVPQPEVSANYQNSAPTNGSVVKFTAETSASKTSDTWTSPFTRSYSIPVKPTSINEIGATQVNNLRQSLMGHPGKRDDRTESVTAFLARGLFSNDTALNKHIIYTTLIRDQSGLGIEAEHRGPQEESETNEMKPGTSNVVISKIIPGGVAARDGKLQVGDLILSINGVDVAGIDQERVTSLLTGTEKFVRIVVARGDCADPIDVALRNMPSRPPLGSWYSSSSSYMSHRPSLTGSYRRPTFGSAISGLSGPGGDMSAARNMANSTAGLPSLLPSSSVSNVHNRSATMHARLQGLRSQEPLILSDSAVPQTKSPPSEVPSSTASMPRGQPTFSRSLDAPTATSSPPTTAIKKPPTPPKPRGLLPTKPEDPEVLSFTEKKRRFEQQELRHTETTTTNVVENSTRLSDAERRAKWRRERLKSLDDDIQLAQALGNQSANFASNEKARHLY